MNNRYHYSEKASIRHEADAIRRGKRLAADAGGEVVPARDPGPRKA